MAESTGMHFVTELILCLFVGVIVIVSLLQPAAFSEAASKFIDMFSSIIDSLFGRSSYEDQIAMDSTKALSCAIDIAAIVGPDGTVGDIVKPDSCMEGTEVGMAIAMYAPKRGPITARVIDAANRISGAVPGVPDSADKCGTDEENEKCGVVLKEDCDKGERCIWGKWNVITGITMPAGWSCVRDPTCDGIPKDRAEAAGEDTYSVCFGEDDHVCVICKEPPIDMVCCGCVGIGKNPPKWMPESECGTVLCPSKMEDKWCKDSSGSKFTCTVVGFELPQNVETGGGFFGDVTDFARTWIGAVGEPRYLVYYETFPRGIETAWTYDTTDKIIAAIAIGGVLNLGGGSFKAAASGVRATGGQLVGLAIVRKAGTKMTIRQAIKNAGKSGRSAASDRLAFEYGGVKALEKMSVERIMKRKIGGSVIGVDGVQNVVDKEMGRVILKNSDETTSMIGKMFGKADDMEKLAGNQKSGLADFSLMIRSGKPIEKGTVDRFVVANKLRKPGDVIPALNDDELKVLTKELDELQKLHHARTLVDGPAEKAIVKSITKELDTSGLLYKKLKKSYLKVVLDEKDKKGMIAAMKKATRLKAIRGEQNAVANKKIDKIAVDIYEDITKTAKMPGVAGTGDKSKFATYFEDAWTDVYNAKGRGTKEIMEGLGTRAETLVRGVPFGKTWKFDTRKKVMVAALVAAHIAMITDASLEKYATCGSGTMCLHFPRYFGDDNNMAYELGEPVMSDYKGLVMTKYPGNKRDRFHVMSPCKADLVVEAHDDDGFCKCEEIYEADKVYYKMQKFMCLAKEKVMAVPINADGTCPDTYMYEGTEYEISVDTDVFEMDNFVCDADEDQEECISRNTHEDPCTDDIDKYGDGCLKVEYRNCYGSDGKDKCEGTYPDDCDSDGHCVGVYSVLGGAAKNIHPAIAASTHQDTFAEPVNMMPHVNVDKSSETVNICKNSWASGVLGDPKGEYNQPCVSVAYDVVSMRGYSKEGFGVNYCGENKAQFRDKLEKTCFWGGMAGAVVVSALSGGVTGTVIVPVAIGSGSIACEKFTNMGGKWPHDQH